MYVIFSRLELKCLSFSVSLFTWSNKEGCWYYNLYNRAFNWGIEYVRYCAKMLYKHKCMCWIFTFLICEPNEKDLLISLKKYLFYFGLLYCINVRAMLPTAINIYFTVSPLPEFTAIKSTPPPTLPKIQWTLNL